MEIEFVDNEIRMEKEINNLDLFVFKFVDIITKLNLKYTIISGYIAILFGRSRNTEDVDMFIEKIEKEKFLLLWKNIHDAGLWCINTNSEDTAYEMLEEQMSIRFAVKDEIQPNMEIKFAKTQLDNYSLQNRICVKIQNNVIYTSPLEIQIAFKMYLGSDKDIEDARHLLILFKENLNMERLKYFAIQLEVRTEDFDNVTREVR